MEDNKNVMNDDKERVVEIILAFAGVSIGGAGIFTGTLTGPLGVGLIGLSFALYQGTSLAKILKQVI